MYALQEQSSLARHAEFETLVGTFLGTVRLQGHRQTPHSPLIAQNSPNSTPGTTRMPTIGAGEGEVTVSVSTSVTGNHR